MEKKVVLLLIVLALLVLSLGIYVNFHYLGLDDSAEAARARNDLNSSSCIEFGCDGPFIGSINSDRYYPCDCRYAKTINPENIICFPSAGDAEDQGYIRSEC